MKRHGGLMKKRKKCIECKKELPGIRSRFCSDTCYLFHKQKRAARLNHLRRRNFPPIKCHICGNKFKPIREDHKNCSKACTRMDVRNKRRNNLFAYQANQDNKVKFDIVTPYSHIPRPIKIKLAPKRIRKHTDPVFCNSNKKENIELRAAVNSFIEQGGVITKYPDEIPEKQESVSIQEKLNMSDSFSIANEFAEIFEQHDNPNSASQQT